MSGCDFHIKKSGTTEYYRSFVSSMPMHGGDFFIILGAKSKKRIGMEVFT
jgi:hypothetical protein